MHMKNPWIELVKNTNKGDNFTVKHINDYVMEFKNRIKFLGPKILFFLKKIESQCK